jgi:hypothetical protein
MKCRIYGAQIVGGAYGWTATNTASLTSGICNSWSVELQILVAMNETHICQLKVCNVVLDVTCISLVIIFRFSSMRSSTFGLSMRYSQYASNLNFTLIESHTQFTFSCA